LPDPKRFQHETIRAPFPWHPRRIRLQLFAVFGVLDSSAYL
jgi:hypothetical protein